MDMIAEVVDQCAQLPDLIFVRSLMGPIQERELPPIVFLGHGFICQKHKILNQLGRHIPVIGPDLDGPSVLVQDHLCLRKIKVYGAPLMAPFPQNTGQLRHPFEQRHQLPVPFRLLWIAFFQDLSHTGIAHTLIHTDDGLRDLRIHDLPFSIHKHDAAQRQPFLTRVEGADPVGQLMGQHGDHPVRKIHAGPPLQSLLVQRAVLLDIIRHIRDMHA